MTQHGQDVESTLEACPHLVSVTPDEASALLAACIGIFGRWGLSTEDSRLLLGGNSLQDPQEWLDGTVDVMPYETIRRLGQVLAIHRALRTMFSDPARAYGWVRRPNDAFGGRAALDIMLAEPMAGLTEVRSYLEAESEA